MEQNQQPEALNTASKLELAVTCGFIGSAAQYQHLLLSAVSQLRALHARVEELESVDANHIAQDRKMVAQEPLGYFKAEPFGWRDCAETDEGAVALYEAPQPQADALDAQRYRWLRAQPLESDMFCTTIWRKGSDGFGDDLRLEELDAAIDAAIAAAKGI